MIHIISQCLDDKTLECCLCLTYFKFENYDIEKFKHMSLFIWKMPIHIHRSWATQIFNNLKPCVEKKYMPKYSGLSSVVLKFEMRDYYFPTHVMCAVISVLDCIFSVVIKFMFSFLLGFFCVSLPYLMSQEPHYHSEILSLHGFHFELKAIRQDTQNHCYQFYMQVNITLFFISSFSI